MSTQTCIVMPGRFGDIINILPCARDITLKQGGKCAVMVSAEFASVLEGCSYVEPVVISSHFTDIQPAIEQAQQMFERVLVAKVNEKSVGVTTQCASFNEESWRQIGYLERWNDLPLVFDRRDRKREAALVSRWSVDQWVGKKGLLALVNFSGRSAPFPYGKEITALLHGHWQVVDLGEVKAHRIYDLLGLMDAADLLVTGDTSTMHLAAASGIPVVNLIGDKPTAWHGSSPRNNSIWNVRYSAVNEWFGRMKFDVPYPWRPRTWHVWSDYTMGGDALRRHRVAAQTWPREWIDFSVKENARVMNDPMRSLPFIKDLVNEAVRCSGPRDVIVLTNADTCVSGEAAARLDEAVRDRGCAYSFRRDFMVLPDGHLAHGHLSTEAIRAGRFYPGADLFACTVEWWQKHGRLLPDLVLGAEAWDWCLRTLMHTTGGAQFDDLIYHEAHPNEWERPEHRNALPSQLHNKRLAAPFLAEHGVAFR